MPPAPMVYVCQTCKTIVEISGSGVGLQFNHHGNPMIQTVVHSPGPSDVSEHHSPNSTAGDGVEAGKTHHSKGDSNNYIEWIAVSTMSGSLFIKHLKETDEPIAEKWELKSNNGGGQSIADRLMEIKKTMWAFCTEHGLWRTDYP